jgi:RNA polymerase sigma-70 factor, ECF subfamily
LDDSAAQLLALLDEYGRRLHVLLVKITLREDVAEELMQELFLKLHRSAGLINANQPERYLFRSAIHLAFDWRSRQKNLQRVTNLSGDEPCTRADPTQRLEQEESLQQILCAIELLPVMERELIVLRFLHQSSYEELAEHRGTTAHRVRALCSKALKRLKHLLTKDFPVETNDD